MPNDVTPRARRRGVLLAPLGARTGLLANLTTGDKTVLDRGIASLAVTATAPAAASVAPSPSCGADGYGYGYGCSSPSPGAGYGGPGYGSSPTCTTSPSPSWSSPGSNTPGSSASPSTVAGTTSGTLPLTGSNTAMYVSGGVLVSLLGRFLMVLARRRTAA
jgi:hypothetical protein